MRSSLTLTGGSSRPAGRLDAGLETGVVVRSVFLIWCDATVEEDEEDEEEGGPTLSLWEEWCGSGPTTECGSWRGACRGKMSSGEDASEVEGGGGVVRTEEDDERGLSGAEDDAAAAAGSGGREGGMEECSVRLSRSRSRSLSRSLLGPSDGPPVLLREAPKPLMWEMGVLLRCCCLMAGAPGDILIGGRPYNMLSLDWSRQTRQRHGKQRQQHNS